MEQVDWTGIDVLLGGHWRDIPEGSPLLPILGDHLDRCVDNTETVDVYRSTQMSANLYRREAEQDDLVAGWAMGPREVELAATGTPYLADPRGEVTEVLPMVPTFDGPGDFGEKLRWWLGHPSERERLAADACEAVADRTFRNAAARLLTELDRLPVNVPVSSGA